MKQAKLFVYGTLMKGFINFNKYLSKNTIRIEKAFVYGKLFHLIDKECPALIEGTDRVFGEVITITDDDKNSILNDIDELERYFKGDRRNIVYTRQGTKVYYEDGKTEILGAYILKDRRFLSINNSIYIPEGDWRVFLKKTVKQKASSY
ncbi:gamma-glutamylcyclotransferase [Clostridium swellfunianum]|uniref:gamma-glutamylcyclotransferase family protein n=1 Tax=Clostridium swellfunianum TaxID=1367462 RepID=UPI00202F04C0|nr:gamma-glutamylcyclotransferase family protein [Clostridium swellfunianum]MCM0649389.1 gamma-glutamylcyclotransferase [Clostridium swellfunianum]